MQATEALMAFPAGLHGSRGAIWIVTLRLRWFCILHRNTPSNRCIQNAISCTLNNNACTHPFSKERLLLETTDMMRNPMTRSEEWTHGNGSENMYVMVTHQFILAGLLAPLVHRKCCHFLLRLSPQGLSFASVSFLFCSLHLREQCMGFVIALRSGGEMQSPSFLLTRNETR